MVAKKINLLAIVGPTASGKTALSIALAKKFQGEIIAADSRTVYAGLDIGTAKPSTKERQGVVHWGFDLAGPDCQLSVADFKNYADTKILEINQKQHLPILVGGSGLYIDAVLYNFSFAPVDIRRRQSLEELDIYQLRQLIVRQNLLLPENYKNKRYLIRAIERGNQPIKKSILPDGYYVIGINPDKATLKERIRKRAYTMIDEGVVAEIQQAVTTYGWKHSAMTGGIYKAFRPYLEGDIDQTQAIEAFIKSDRRLAKKQMTWFKRNSDIKWFNDIDQAGAWFESLFGGKLK